MPQFVVPQKNLPLSHRMARGGFCILPNKGGTIGRLNAVFFLETIDTTACVYELLLTREKWVASGANLNANVRFDRTRLDGIAASASSRHSVVRRMNALFHLVHLFLPCIACGRRVKIAHRRIISRM